MICADARWGVEAVPAVDAAVDALLAARAQPSRRDVVDAIAAHLPGPNMSEVIALITKDMEGGRQFIGHVRALHSTVASAAGRLP